MVWFLTILTTCFHGGYGLAENQHLRVGEGRAFGSVAVDAARHDVSEDVANVWVNAVKAESGFWQLALAVVARFGAKPEVVFALDCEQDATPLGDGLRSRELARKASHRLLRPGPSAWLAAGVFTGKGFGRLVSFADTASPLTWYSHPSPTAAALDIYSVSHAAFIPRRATKGSIER